MTKPPRARRSPQQTREPHARRAPAHGKRWSRRSDARPGELIAAALRLFSENGFAATRLEDVAAAAGVSKATVYLYFANKERLLEAVIRNAIDSGFDRADLFFDAFDGPTPNLVRTLLRLLEAMALDGPFPALLKLLISEAANFPEIARIWGEAGPKRMLALIQRVIQRGIDRGEFRPISAAVVAPLVLSPVFLLAVWQYSLTPHLKLELDRSAITSAHVEILLRGLAVDPASEVIS
ncbi:MAG: TetR/AcrR family transcriptional regulator [Kofleriaceae bacterium]